MWWIQMRSTSSLILPPICMSLSPDCSELRKCSFPFETSVREFRWKWEIITLRAKGTFWTEMFLKDKRQMKVDAHASNNQQETSPAGQDKIWMANSLTLHPKRKVPMQLNYIFQVLSTTGLPQLWANKICIWRHWNVNSWSQLSTDFNGPMNRIRQEVANKILVDRGAHVHCH